MRNPVAKSSRRQKEGETISQYLLSLKILSKECDFKSVSAEEHRGGYIRDVFISGLISTNIRQRLLENEKLDLDQAFTQARALEAAQNQSACYMISPPDPITLNSVSKQNNSSNYENSSPGVDKEHETQVSALNSKCYFCGFARHPF